MTTLTQFHPWQRDVAAAALTRGEIHPITPLPGTYAVLSRNGERAYYTTREVCTCPAYVSGEGMRCWHRAAVILAILL